jgi:hypothetical protein
MSAPLTSDQDYQGAQAKNLRVHNITDASDLEHKEDGALVYDAKPGEKRLKFYDAESDDLVRVPRLDRDFVAGENVSLDVDAQGRLAISVDPDGVRSFTHVQDVPADIWTGQHTLGYRPTSATVWINGIQTFAAIEVTETDFTVRFGGNYAGELKLI